jgi:hypothetical protein
MDPFATLRPANIPDAFLRKCDICCSFSDFRDGSNDEDFCRCKTDLLQDILNGILNPTVAQLLGSDHISALFRLCSVHLFRTFPHVSFMEKPEFVYDREFHHIELVYEILLNLLSFKTVRKELVASRIHQAFVNNLFSAVCSYDFREQQFVVQALSCFVREFPCTSGPLFRRICRCCVPLNESFHHAHAIPSIAALLASLAPVLVKDQKAAQKFFREFIIPLHKCPSYSLYLDPLTRLVIHVVTIDNSLLPIFIQYITKHWAVHSHEKSALFFDEISAICQSFAVEISDECVVTLVKKIASFFTDPAGKVSQQALSLLGSEVMRPLLKRCPESLLQHLYQRAMEVSAMHWLRETRQSACDLVGELVIMNPGLKRSLILSDLADSGEAKKRRIWVEIIGVAPPEERGWQFTRLFGR